MLVDLSRNDLVKVCEPTSVEVVEFMAVKRYSHIMHICSTVVGRLREGATALQTLDRDVPGGHALGRTQAARDRAHRPDRARAPRHLRRDGRLLRLRGRHGHGHRDPDGADPRRRASVQAGGGIVADSVPALEYEESRNKAAAAVRAVQVASRLRRAGA